MGRVLKTLALTVAFVLAALAQAPASKATSEGHIFSGTVTAVAPDKITVVLKVPAKPDESRDFAIDKDTKVEGRLRVNARVSVRFNTGDDGESHALRIIVRTDTKTGGPATPKPPATKR
ncbi:MAG TPA: DUF5666 domain-containing protein [Bryobacteraceae bacterium]|nr:DUF5666 domain-containing protein [Bryobacteraceae bacterium]